MQQPRRIKQTFPFGERLAQEARRCREQAETMPPGIERESFLRKAQQADTAARINKWLASPGLRPPK
jgi:hypothetical protein